MGKASAAFSPAAVAQRNLERARSLEKEAARIRQEEEAAARIKTEAPAKASPTAPAEKTNPVQPPAQAPSWQAPPSVTQSPLAGSEFGKTVTAGIFALDGNPAALNPDPERPKFRVNPNGTTLQAVQSEKLAPPTPLARGTYYTAQKGDHLWKIARGLHPSNTDDKIIKKEVDGILSGNPPRQNPELVQPGERIWIPSAENSKAENSKPPEPPAGGELKVTKDGLRRTSDIAQAFVDHNRTKVGLEKLNAADVEAKIRELNPGLPTGAGDLPDLTSVKIPSLADFTPKPPQEVTAATVAGTPAVEGPATSGPKPGETYKVRDEKMLADVARSVYPGLKDEELPSALFAIRDANRDFELFKNAAVWRNGDLKVKGGQSIKIPERDSFKSIPLATLQGSLLAESVANSRIVEFNKAIETLKLGPASQEQAGKINQLSQEIRNTAGLANPLLADFANVADEVGNKDKKISLQELRAFIRDRQDKLDALDKEDPRISLALRTLSELILKAQAG
jgi:LysM repeat protein